MKEKLVDVIQCDEYVNEARERMAEAKYMSRLIVFENDSQKKSAFDLKTRLQTLINESEHFLNF